MFYHTIYNTHDTRTITMHSTTVPCIYTVSQVACCWHSACITLWLTLTYVAVALPSQLCLAVYKTAVRVGDAVSWLGGWASLWHPPRASSVVKHLCMKYTTLLYVVLRLMGGFISPLPHMPLWYVQGYLCLLYFTFTVPHYVFCNDTSYIAVSGTQFT